MITVSVILCTRNRASSLKPTLESIARTRVPAGWRVDLLVVDNGSTDATAEVVSDFTHRTPYASGVVEKTAGLARARNCGLARTAGEIVVFTDDDVRVPEYWIEPMCQAILSRGTDAVAGGVVFPAGIEAALSKSPLAQRRSWFASTEELDPDHPCRLVGANMAFHRRVLRKVPGFDVDLGAGAIGFGEETLFSRQILAAGYKVAGALRVAVEHHFDLLRLTSVNLAEMARKHGRTDAFIAHHWDHWKVRRLRSRLEWHRVARLAARCTDAARRPEAPFPSDRTLRLERRLAFLEELLLQQRVPWKYGAP